MPRAHTIIPLIALSCTACDIVQAARLELQLTVAVGPAYAIGKAAQNWANLVSERSAGEITVKVVPGANLAARDPRRELAALRDGKADLAVASSLVWSGTVRELALPSLPWIAPSVPQLQALARGVVEEKLLAAVEAAGVKPLALGVVGHHALATRAKPVHEPADLAGVTVRVQPNALVQEMYIALGAKPIVLDGATAREALGRGELEAQDGSPVAFSAARTDSLGVRHVTLLAATGELAVFAMNRARWDALTDVQRSIVSGAAREIANGLPAAVAQQREAALTALRSRDVAVTRLLPAAYAPFVTAVQGVIDRWTATIGAELVAAARKASADAAPQ
jgi:TRAP-type C4-dicarboxylate transport system substrate-binding protein